MSDNDNKFDKILENKINYQNNVEIDDELDEELDEIVSEISELFEKAPENEKNQIVKELSDEMRKAVLDDVVMTQLLMNSKNRDS